MNILYDISVLGFGFYSQRARTGVARAIHCLAEQLLQQIPGQIDLCACHSLRAYLAAKKYIASGALGDQVQLCQPSSHLINQLVSGLAKIYPSPASPKLIRRLFEMATILPNGLLQTPSKRALADSDIYHATFYPFPRQTDEFHTLRRFITIYDLIPLIHPEYFTVSEEKLMRLAYQSIRPTDWVFAISASTKNDLCNHADIDPDRVFVTPLAASAQFKRCIDTRRIKSTLQQFSIPDVPYLLSVSTLEPRKNIERTIRCFLDLIQQQGMQDLNLVLVGTKGWKFERIFHSIASVPALRKRIIITGYVSDADLAVLYSGAFAFIYPSYYEGFGLPPLEAMQCGTPVITSNTSSLPEIVGNAGIMIDPSDDDALSGAMYRLYTDSSLRQRLAAAAGERANCFSWETCAKQTLHGYRTAMAHQ